MTPAEALAKKKAEKMKGRKGGLASYGGRKAKFDCKLLAMLDEMGLSSCDMSKACGFHGSGVYPVLYGSNLTLVNAMKIAKFFGRPIEDIWSLKEEKKGK